MVVRFTTTCAIGAYHHYSCEFEPRGDVTIVYSIQHYVIKLSVTLWFSQGTTVSSTNKTNYRDISKRSSNTNPTKNRW
jgi:hypothetical protein